MRRPFRAQCGVGATDLGRRPDGLAPGYGEAAPLGLRTGRNTRANEPLLPRCEYACGKAEAFPLLSGIGCRGLIVTESMRHNPERDGVARLPAATYAAQAGPFSRAAVAGKA